VVWFDDFVSPLPILLVGSPAHFKERVSDCFMLSFSFQKICSFVGKAKAVP
jgi:hypothetical protein